MALQDLLRRLLPREPRFFDVLELQADVLHEAALALVAVEEAGERARVVGALEQRGDEGVASMEQALGRWYVTPLEREDLHGLSSELDDVLDAIHAAARAATTVGLPRLTADMLAIAELLARSTARIRERVFALRPAAFSSITARADADRELELATERQLRGALARVLWDDAGLTARRVLQEKSVLDELARAVEGARRLRSLLVNVAIKHG